MNNHILDSACMEMISCRAVTLALTAIVKLSRELLGVDETSIKEFLKSWSGVFKKCWNRIFRMLESLLFSSSKNVSKMSHFCQKCS